MRTYNYSQACSAVDAFIRDYAGDFDRTALIDVLFEEVATHPQYGMLFIEREYTDDEIQACDVTAWQPCEAPTTGGATMRAERWFTSPKRGPVHAGIWKDECDVVSLTLASVEYGGQSPWSSGCEFIADSARADTWGELDWAYGSRKAWEADLATAEAMIRQS